VVDGGRRIWRWFGKGRGFYDAVRRRDGSVQRVRIDGRVECSCKAKKSRAFEDVFRVLEVERDLLCCQSHPAALHCHKCLSLHPVEL
jgi:hypothetical protein